MSTENLTTKRTMENYNIWRLVINNHISFPEVIKKTVERQKRDDIMDVDITKKNIWLPLKKTQEYKESTIREFQSLLIKIVYCLIDDKDLDNYGWYDLDREMESLLLSKSLMDVEEFIERLLELGGVNKKRLQAIINFYTRSMKLPDYKIPTNVELPRDKEKKKKLAKNKTIDLKDDFITPVQEYIVKEIQHKNFYNNKSLIRGAIAFNIMNGSAIRITNAYQLKLEDLQAIYEKGEHKVNNFKIKHSKVNFGYINCINKRAIKLALDLYRKIPADTLNKISLKSPTRFKDIKVLFTCVYGNDAENNNFTSNMIRKFVADSMLNRGYSLTKTSKMMNHSSLSATKHYINQFHPGPSMINNDDDDDDNYSDEYNLIQNI
ncbi:VLF-1 [Choristoneura occidentalis granulovirus]|uniref:VLF-1 n=1 Tax=Choristoneura occidentalis granulovirus TaxID=364745 RepID=Q1A4L0_9BBAC|nr:VLF-1 [Choristoneura fumiferana granulovirus]ABC61220.1 VLF-1 [Choristoneura fumiferana granulovirus]